MKLNRRDLLKTGIAGVALRALATGIPASVLMRPRSARAQAMGKGSMLILFTSQNGDPLNANVPGTYGTGVADVAHSADPRMVATTLRLSGTNHTAAKPWADLPQTTLDRTVFFHHATYTPVHQDQSKVMRLMGATDDNEMLVSMFAKELAQRQGTVQAVPLSLGARGGSELLSSGGQVLANVGPQSIKRALGGAQGPLAALHEMRDRDIDRIYALYREHGTKKDLALLDGWARSRDEVRSVSDALVSRLDAIDSDDEDNQVAAASVLAAMNITPAITVRGRWGGDNHNDGGLTTESNEHVTGIARMQSLVAALDQLRADGILRQDVIVGSLNVFGRTLKRKGTNGRDHNRGHHVTVMIGNAFRGGLVGGITASGGDYNATGIDSATGGARASGGDIPYEETLGSMAKTLGLAVGIPRARLDEMIKLGKPVMSVIA